MRYRLAHIVLVATTCLLAGGPSVHAQSAVSTADPEIPSERSCPASPAAGDKQPSGPEISIAEVTFSGALEMAASDQDQIAASIEQRTHGNSLDEVTDGALERVRAGWQDHGYLKVQVSGEANTLISSSASQRIAIIAHVDESPQYNLGGITFKHNKTISNVEALRGLFPIKDGDIFSRDKIATGLENLREAYGELGYINFTSIPDTTFDEEKKLISLDIDLDEGKQFSAGSVNILGLDEPARGELLKDFPMKRGQIFNQKLFESFLLKHASMFPDCGCGNDPRWLDEKAGIVTLTFDFRPCSVD